jgi:hypothetical protein
MRCMCFLRARCAPFAAAIFTAFLLPLKTFELGHSMMIKNIFSTLPTVTLGK